MADLIFDDAWVAVCMELGPGKTPDVVAAELTSALEEERADAFLLATMRALDAAVGWRLNKCGL